MKHDNNIRNHLINLLSWEDAHVNFESAVKDLPAKFRGVKPEGIPYTIWQLVEHIRIAQYDILDFSMNPNYIELKWPDDYWPKEEAPANDSQWENSILKIKQDRESMIELIRDTKNDLFAPFKHGEGQTLFREAVLIADHTAYHVGQIVLIRKLLNIW